MTLQPMLSRASQLFIKFAEKSRSEASRLIINVNGHYSDYYERQFGSPSGQLMITFRMNFFILFKSL